MELSTKYFDKISVSEKDIIRFEHGLFGFETLKEHILISFEPGNDNLMCLQSVQDSELAFILMNPFNLKKDYSPILTDSDIRELEIKDDTEGVLYYAVCVVKDDVSESTVNLKCPLVINPQSQAAKQLILDDERYSFRHSLQKLMEGDV
ncbi:flagellar assembly protein FliW [Proteocatella sphenisci]|uniref:flagellar assembly protein FliW n=1 Tax=Proteocatella sphenisci TaxID=181070 RepID=UPI000490329E|nr:flagellar assembly protein FliW [Proteocatella sphenisci]